MVCDAVSDTSVVPQVYLSQQQSVMQGGTAQVATLRPNPLLDSVNQATSVPRAVLLRNCVLLACTVILLSSEHPQETAQLDITA